MTMNFRIDVTASTCSLLAGLIHIGAYQGWWWTPPSSGTDLFWRLGGSVVLIVIAVIIVATVVRASNADAPERDERETQAGLKAAYNTAMAFSGGVTLLLIYAFTPLSPMLLAHSLIGVICLAELTRLSSLLYYLNRGL